MAREIKFRAWDKELKRMLPSPSGSITTDRLGLNHSLVLRYPATFVVMQYTGLQDKNRVEIYEGDVVRHSTKIPGRLEWLAGFQMPVIWIQSGLAYNMWRPQEAERWEVIGNIYENPELVV